MDHMDTMTLDTRALQLPLDFSDGAGPASPYRPSPAPSAPSALRRLVADVLSAEPAAIAARRAAPPGDLFFCQKTGLTYSDG